MSRYPQFSFWIHVANTKICFSRIVTKCAKILQSVLRGAVLKSAQIHKRSPCPRHTFSKITRERDENSTIKCSPIKLNIVEKMYFSVSVLGNENPNSPTPVAKN